LRRGFVLIRSFSYTVKVVDVFAMPQSGTGVSVEAVDDEFQTAMLEMLKQTGRPEVVVGWYHSHPGFGCWLSSVDCNTQQSFEQLNPRAVAVVVDPIQSVKYVIVLFSALLTPFAGAKW
jgi:26S proteasome regulatory subunit N11